MTWDFYHQGFPPDLDKRFTAARTKAEVAFRKAKAGRPPSDVRRLLIDVRILPEVIAYAGCMCEMARREHVRVSEIEPYVDSYLRAVARTLCPDDHTQSASSELFVREVVKRVTESDEWDAYLTERLSVTEPLTADAASKAVERREETPATPAAGAVEESQAEQPIAPLPPAAPDESPLVTLAEGAQRLSVHKETLRRMGKRGQAHLIRVGGRDMISLSEIKRLRSTDQIRYR
jgi:hypothetical protein